MTSQQLDSFQISLLSDLRQHVTDRSEDATSEGTGLVVVSSGRRRRKTLAWVGGLAAACAAAAVALPGLSAQPAYAITTEPGGVVHVQVNRLEEASQLQADLKRHGIKADIRYLPTGTQCSPHRFTSAPSASDSATAFTVGSSGIDVTIDRRDVNDGTTVVLSASRSSEQQGVNAEVGVARGNVGACQPVPVPDLPN